MDLSQWGMLWIVVLFTAGLLFLFGSGHVLVQGSSRLARHLGIHPVIIGLTVVALGTSMPEFVVSLMAAIRGKAGVALGNIVGSNVSNLGLILGLSALVRPIDVNLKLLKFEVPLVIIVSVVFWALCANGTLSRIDGFVLATGFLAYLTIVIWGARKESAALREAYQKSNGVQTKMGRNIIMIVGGIAGLSLGADWIVGGASEISRRLGASELILGLTVVAVGTSLPELATSAVAAFKKEGDISVGNILGSNLFNMMAVAGPSALLHPLVVDRALIFYHLPAMTALTLLIFPLLRTGRRLGRLEGGILLACYVAIMTFWIYLAL